MMSLRKRYRFFATATAALTLALMGPTLYLQGILPDRFTVHAGQELSLPAPYELVQCSTVKGDSAVSSSTSPRSYSTELKLLGVVKIKDVSVRIMDEQEVAICGVPFGIKMSTDGVLVVGTGAIQCSSGSVNPAKQAGIIEGDRLLSINGQTTLSNSLIAQLVRQSQGAPLTILVAREKEEQVQTFQTVVTPVLSLTDGEYHIGLWVRDSSAGIGTLTFCDPATGEFGGLGHAICDVDTGQLMPLAQGEVVRASITGLRQGLPGQPGELQGTFSHSESWGFLRDNCSSGVYGQFSTDWNDFPLISTAHAQEVVQGPALLLCTTSGNSPRYYDVEIERIQSYDDPKGRNLVLHITDPELLAQTGGIVQGMSGSPIVQNGKLIGAVTHVFVGDPTRGYGIFIDNMLEAAA